MSSITPALVKELRERTGAGMMDCKRALEDTGGNIEEAVVKLREKGLAAAAKRAGRVAAEGIVHSYIHGGGRIGVLIEVNCETDFVARNDSFQELVRDLAMHVAAAQPLYLNRDEVPADVVEKEREILRAQALAEGKKPEIVEKMIEGRLNKFFERVCLEEQPFIKDPDQTVGKLVQHASGTIGEKISVRRFTRYEVGEGLDTNTEE